MHRRVFRWNACAAWLLVGLVVAPAAWAVLFNGRVNWGPNRATGRFDIEIIDPDGIMDYRVLQGRGAAGPAEIPWTGGGDCPRRVRFPLPGVAAPHLRHDHRIDYHDCQSPPQLETWIVSGGLPFSPGVEGDGLTDATRVVVAVPYDDTTQGELLVWLRVTAGLLVLLLLSILAVLYRLRRSKP